MRNLDEIWKLCKSMWRWVAEHIDEFNGNVPKAKSVWLNDHGFVGSKRPRSDCFFCDAAGVGSCEFCPGYDIDPAFDCGDSDYSHYTKPKKFYNKIRSMDRKRKQGAK